VPEPPQQVSDSPISPRVAGIAYRVEGRVAPVLHMALDGTAAVLFEQVALVWRSPGLDITDVGLDRLDPGVGDEADSTPPTRRLGGHPVWLMSTSGAGEFALSRGDAGRIVGLAVAPGTGLLVREHQFVAATANLAYSFHRITGPAGARSSAAGYFVDQFRSDSGEAGIVWVQSHGDLFEQRLGPSDEVDVAPGAFVYTDLSLAMTVVTPKMSVGGRVFALNRFKGPGRIGIQARIDHEATELA
jgi:uncharacterized protein (AIM24 family)